MYRRFIREAAELVIGMGGSISGEHGDGQSKAELLETMFGAKLMQAFREFKRIWDPDNRMNPGKVIDAYRADQNLRLGTRYDPPTVPVHFHYAEHGGDFSRAMLGVGECRKREGTMCPSYMATGEEKHSTRVVIDFSKYLNRIVEIDPRRKRARVQRVVLDDLRRAAREHGLTFAPDPATHNHNTIGGMIGNNSCGPHSVMGGTTVENVLGLDILTYAGKAPP